MRSSLTRCVSLLVVLLAALGRAEEESNVQILLEEASQAGACDGAVTDKYREIVQTLETQHNQMLEEAQASCQAQSQIQLAAAEESVQEYKELAEQAQQEKQDLQAKLEEDLAAAKRNAEDQTKQLETELQRLTANYSELKQKQGATASELAAARQSFSEAKAKAATMQAELDATRQELEEVSSMYINWHLIQRQYQERKGAVEHFYTGTVLPFFATTKETLVNVYNMAVEKYHELCIALEPVLEALGKLTRQAWEHAKQAWEQLVTIATPHVETARAAFDETAGPHVAVASEKLQLAKAESIRKLQDSPVYPHLLKVLAALEQVQKLISGGLKQMAKKALTLLEQYDAPEKLVTAATYVKDHSTDVAIYLEGSIATLLMILILNSVLGGGGGGGGRARRRAAAAAVNGYSSKSKIKKA